jgi:hypothetical protein
VKAGARDPAAVGVVADLCGGYGGTTRASAAEN